MSDGENLNLELAEMPKKMEQMEEYKRALSGCDYNIIELYESNPDQKELGELKDEDG